MDVEIPVGTMTEEEAEKQKEAVQAEFSGLPGFVWNKFHQAEHARLGDEQRWLRAYKDFRGQYIPSMTFRDSEKSRVFIKIPKTKTLAAYGQIVEIVFAGSKFPIGIKPTEKPTGIAERAHLEGPSDQQSGGVAPELNVGYPGDNYKSATDAVLGSLKAMFRNAPFIAGKSVDPNVPTIKPAEIAAQKMEKTIHDQLTETNAVRQVRAAILEQVIYGSGCLKGPYNDVKTIHKWEIETPEDLETEKAKRKYTPEHTTVPGLEHVSIWDVYPDPNAEYTEECDYFIQRRKMSASQLRKLAKRPFFNSSAIADAINSGPNYVKRGVEDQVRDTQAQQFTEDRYEVLEYWGYLDKQMALEWGDADLFDDMSELDEVQVNVWLCGSHVLRLAINPFEPERIPYHVFPYEKNPHEFFGIGVPENMADSTMIMNGHARMAIDNLALSGSLVFDIDDSALVPGQAFEIYPGKTFRRQSGQPGQAVYGIKFPNTTNENMMMFDRFRQLADEQTGIPSYSHGATGVQSTTRTASGMSMLMGAAALSIKTVVKNLDDYLLKPLGESYFFWNMQFNPDVEVKGDVDIKALGTEAIMQKEVRSQRLMQFLQIVSNPVLAPFANLNRIVKEIAISLDIDPDDVVNDMETAKLYAQIMGTAGASGQGEQSGPNMGMMGNGGGNIGTGAPPMPQEQGFSGQPMPQKPEMDMSTSANA